MTNKLRNQREGARIKNKDNGASCTKNKMLEIITEGGRNNFSVVVMMRLVSILHPINRDVFYLDVWAYFYLLAPLTCYSLLVWIYFVYDVRIVHLLLFLSQLYSAYHWASWYLILACLPISPPFKTIWTLSTVVFAITIFHLWIFQLLGRLWFYKFACLEY